MLSEILKIRNKDLSFKLYMSHMNRFSYVSVQGKGVFYVLL